MNKSILCLLVLSLTLGYAFGQTASPSYLLEEETIANYGPAVV